MDIASSTFLGNLEENDMLRSVLLTVLLSFALSANAEDFDYNFFSAGYSRINFDDGNFDVDGDGFGVGGSFEVGESFFLFANYATAGLDFGVDLDQWDAGVGYHVPMSDAVDFYGTLSYEYAKVSASGFGSADDNGYGLGIGLRAQASDSIELNAGINYVDLGDSGDTTAFSAGGLFSLTDNIDIGLSGSWDDDVSTYTLSGRFYFGQ